LEVAVDLPTKLGPDSPTSKQQAHRVVSFAYGSRSVHRSHLRAARREPGKRWAFWYYTPAPLPRDLGLAPRTVLALSEADSALGHLQGLGRLIKDPELLLGPYITREAVASSRIEGTETSLSEVLRSEVSEGSASIDVQEVDGFS